MDPLTFKETYNRIFAEHEDAAEEIGLPHGIASDYADHQARRKTQDWLAHRADDAKTRFRESH